MLAIPAHLAHHFLNGRVRVIVRDVEWSGNEIMKYLVTEYQVEGNRQMAAPAGSINP
jgi:biopolymer transport protein ExbB